VCQFARMPDLLCTLPGPRILFQETACGSRVCQFARMPDLLCALPGPRIFPCPEASCGQAVHCALPAVPRPSGTHTAVSLPTERNALLVSRMPPQSASRAFRKSRVWGDPGMRASSAWCVVCGNGIPVGPSHAWSGIERDEPMFQPQGTARAPHAATRSVAIFRQRQSVG
jgi:hypothetical protein